MNRHLSTSYHRRKNRHRSVKFNNHVTIIAHMMSGLNIIAHVKKSDDFMTVRNQIADQMNLEWNDVHLMLNYEKPDPSATIRSLLTELKEAHYTLELLVDTRY